MKKLFATLMTLVVLSMAALPVAAQTRGRASRSNYNDRSIRRYDSRYDRSVNREHANRSYAYNNDNYRYDNNDSLWDEHRDKITTVGGAVGGAILGGVIGGKKGAIIGAIAGGAGAAIYTYKIRDKSYPY